MKSFAEYYRENRTTKTTDADKSKKSVQSSPINKQTEKDRPK
jgi:hypothetical protein